MFLVHAQDQHTQFRLFGLYLLDEVHAALPWHRHVQKEDVEIQVAHPLQNLVAVAGFAGDLQVR